MRGKNTIWKAFFVLGCVLVLLTVGLYGTGQLDFLLQKDSGVRNNKETEKAPIVGEKVSPGVSTPTVIEPTEDTHYSYINPEGTTLETRILPPEGYSRKEEKNYSLTTYLRTYAMKKDRARVLLYNGSEKPNQLAHVAVFQLPLGNRNLQQCADSIIRIYAEYYWSQKKYDKIAFHFTNGFLATYKKWQEGYRIKVDGNQVSWVKSGSFDDSYESFVKYLDTVFCYAGTLSMGEESKSIALSDLQVGDVFLKSGSPGHVVMVVDICENPQGKKAFLLAQGFMPAQEFHVLKSEYESEDPWYYLEDVTYPFHTPQYTFDKGSLRRLDY